MQYSVVFNKKINLLMRNASATNIFLGKLWIFQKQPLEVFYGKAVFKILAIFTGWICRPATLLKRDSNTGVFLWILWNLSEHLFWRTSANSCFWLFKTPIEHQWAAVSVLNLIKFGWFSNRLWTVKQTNLCFISKRLIHVT